MFVVALMLAACRSMVGNPPASTAPSTEPSTTAPPSASVSQGPATSSPEALPTKATATESPDNPTGNSSGCGPPEIPPLGPENVGTPPSPLVPPPRILSAGEVVTSTDDVRSRGFDAILPTAIPAGVLLQAITVEAGFGGSINELRLYYSPTPVNTATTLSDVIADGGMLLLQRVSRGVDAAYVKEEVGERAVIVEVGPYDAALIWGDPVHHGVRAYSLLWSDGTYDWTLRSGFETPESAVSVGRSIYCT